MCGTAAEVTPLRSVDDHELGVGPVTLRDPAGVPRHRARPERAVVAVARPRAAARALSCEHGTRRASSSQRPWIDERDEELVLEVLRSGWLSLGPTGAALRVAVRRARSVRRTAPRSRPAPRGCTSACALAGVGPGDEVITSPYSFVASANCAIYEGATPVFADIDPHTYNLDPAAVEAAITPRTRAIVAVDIFGYPCELDELRRSASGTGWRCRGRVRGARRAVQGTADRLARPSGRLGVLPQQADDDRRGRRGHDARRGASTSCSSRCATRAGSRRRAGSSTGASASTTGSTTSPPRSASASSRSSTASSRRARAVAAGATPSCSPASTSSCRSPTTRTTCARGSCTSSSCRPASIATRVIAPARGRRDRDGAVPAVDPPAVVHARALRLPRGDAAGERGLQRADDGAAVPRRGSSATTRSASPSAARGDRVGERRAAGGRDERDPDRGVEEAAVAHWKVSPGRRWSARERRPRRPPRPPRASAEPRARPAAGGVGRRRRPARGDASARSDVRREMRRSARARRHRGRRTRSSRTMAAVRSRGGESGSRRAPERARRSSALGSRWRGSGTARTSSGASSSGARS